MTVRTRSGSGAPNGTAVAGAEPLRETCHLLTEAKPT